MSQPDPVEECEESRRRRRSLAYCRMWAASIEGLEGTKRPAIVAADAVLRSHAEVARRILAATLVGLKGQGLTPAETFAFADAYGVWGALADDEEQLVLDPSPSEDSMAGAVGRFEGAWVLLWAMGLVRYLDFPDRSCDPARVTELSIREVATGRADAFRPLSDILDVVDVHVRLRVATRADETIRALPVVVRERVEALDWLIGLAV